MNNSFPSNIELNRRVGATNCFQSGSQLLRIFAFGKNTKFSHTSTKTDSYLQHLTKLASPVKIPRGSKKRARRCRQTLFYYS